MRTKLYSASVLFLSVCLASPGHAQPAPAEDEVPIEEGELEEEGEEIAPVEEDEPAPPPEEPPAEAPPPEVSEEEFFEEGVEDPARPPPAGKGVVWGVVTDSEGQPVLEGPVQVIGTKTQVITDFDGQYRLELAPGNYSLRFFYEFHQPMRVDISVGAGEVKQLDAALEADKEAPVEEFVVEAKLEEASIESQNLERQRSASVTDGIGRQEISKTPDSDAAAAAQRVVGANIVDGRFVYVRGLGERYSNALLFGSPLPSPEPDKAAVPLDLFPALVLDSVNIAKTFTPDMPGDFAGGSVQIETRGVPEEFVFNVSLSGTYNTQTTFQDRLDYSGGSTDWLGFDDGTRAMPDLPDYKLKRLEPKPGGGTVGSDDLVGPAHQLNTPMSAKRSTAPPGHGASVVIGNGWLLGGEQKIGVIGSLNYKRDYQIRDGVLKEYDVSNTDDRGLTERWDITVEEGEMAVDWGAFASVAYQPTSKHELRLMGLHSQSAEDSTALYDGFDDNTMARTISSQLDWVERGLTLGQLSGRHTFDPLNSAELGWDLAIARASRAQPDRRDVSFDRVNRTDLTGWNYRDGSESGRHFFSDQTEDSFNGKLDWTQPLVDTTKLKAGGLAALKDREFSARRFAFRSDANAPERVCETDIYQLTCPDEVLTHENIDNGILRVEEGTESGDAYNASLDVYAGYLMGDIELAESLRAVVGGRVEHTDQNIEPFDQITGENLEGSFVELKVTNFLPSAGLVFSATQRAKVRISYGRTLARPQLRELAPFRFSDYFGGRNVNGNPDLTLTTIDNYDTRFEYYPTLREVLAFSFFLKTFQDPIEPILIPTSTTNLLTYRNAEGAHLIGVEFEGRKDLDFLTPVLKDFQLVSNLTLARSRTEIGEDDAGFLTSKSRALVNQAPWVFNVSLDYENEHGTRARVLYNVSGKKLVEVGTRYQGTPADTPGLPDSYEHPEHSLDLIASQKFAEHWTVKAQATNVLNAETLVTAGKEDSAGDSNTIKRYKDGVDIGVGLSFTY